MEFFFNNQFFFGEEILNSLHIFGGVTLDYFMIFITHIGSQMFYTLSLPILYWSYDRKIAIRLGFVFLASSFINTYCKEIFSNPRPVADNLLTGLKELSIRLRPSSPGFPSGHTQGSITFWIASSYFIRKKFIYKISLFMIILIPYSRIYLGVHYMGDILGGIILAILSLLIFIPVVSLTEKRQDLIHDSIIYFSILLIPAGLMFIINIKFLATILGIMSGFIFGAFLFFKKENTIIRKNVKSIILKIIIGITILLLIKAGIKFILPEGIVFQYIRYWLMGIWISYFAPILFLRLKLDG
jgi:membrane-associated phospholipid phosphatase